MRLVVLGCGPTALGLAYHLNNLLKSEKVPQNLRNKIQVTIIEKEDHPGGLAYTEKDANGFLWDYGIHATFSHYEYYDQALDWAVKDWNFLTRNAKVDMAYLFGEKGLKLLPYPAQYSVPLFPSEEKNLCLRELGTLHGNGRTKNLHNPTLESYEAWVLKNFGPTLCRVFFRPYNKKLWTVDIEDMCASWIGERVAQIDLRLLQELCQKDRGELEAGDYGWGPNAKFRYPKYGGVGSVWAGIQKKLPEEWFKFGQEVIGVDPVRKTVTVQKIPDTPQEIPYDFLVSTIPLTTLGRISGLMPKINLHNNRIVVVGLGLMLPQPDWLKNKSWLYFPGDDTPFYRLTPLSNYSQAVTPDPQAYWSLLFECARSPAEDGHWSKEEIVQSCIEATVGKGFVEDKSKIVSIFAKVVPFGYPIPSLDRDLVLRETQGVFELHGIYSRGRFGGWKYEVSNQDHSFMQGKEILDRILFGSKETVYTV